MTIYRQKLEDKVQTKTTEKESAAVMKDDDEVCTLHARMHSQSQVVVYLFHLYWHYRYLLEM